MNMNNSILAAPAAEITFKHPGYPHLLRANCYVYFNCSNLAVFTGRITHINFNGGPTFTITDVHRAGNPHIKIDGEITRSARELIAFADAKAAYPPFDGVQFPW